MFVARLPNNLQHQFDTPVTIMQIAHAISADLAKTAIAGKVNGQLVDIYFIVNQDSNVAIITKKDIDFLYIIRHSTAHLLAYAVKELFPEAQIVHGPVIENGFYYDFFYKRSFTPADLALIENKMTSLVKQDITIVRQVVSRSEAIAYFMSINETYKIEIINSISKDQVISLYTIGKFIDLCRGPHVSSTNNLKVFKLLKVAGAYWQSNSKYPMLQRIYGTAWVNQADQDNYLHMLQEAEKRDHRKLGSMLDLFHFDIEAPGLIFWHANGCIIWRQVEQYMRQIYDVNNYQEIRTPQILDRSLWMRTGHWDYYRENMFVTESENRIYAIKPMNCPAHIQIFKNTLRSYRELPLRYGEFGYCHRNEPSGALHGAIRVRGFTQDDGHIFCTIKQIQDEVIKFNSIVHAVYADFGFRDVLVKLSLRPKKRIGTEELWNIAENGLREAMRISGVMWEELYGEGAFYGPKIEYHLKDSIGRCWQCGTLQVDFSMPARLGAEYISEDNNRKVPVMLHRAVIGSLERFIAILVESYGGALPVWLAPMQIVILNISDAQIEYVKNVACILKKQGFRVETDLRNEKITYKIRKHSLKKIPYILIVGDKECRANMVAVRTRGNINLGQMPVEILINYINAAIKNKT